MPCNCDSQLDSIMKLLEETRAEIGIVKTKCIRIEKEILGITAESELNPEALMETTTVRHLVEKLSFDVSSLTLESSKQTSSEEKRQKEMEAACKNLHGKFAESITANINDLKLKYNVVAPETFQAKFSGVLKEFRSETEEDLFQRGFSSFIIHDVVQDVVRSTDSNTLYGTHFLEKYEETGRSIRDQYSDAVEIYVEKAIEKRMNNWLESWQKVTVEFLNKFKPCEVSFACFQEELLNKVQNIPEQIEANRGLLERLTKRYRRLRLKGRVVSPTRQLENWEASLKRQIVVSDQKLVALFVKKLRENMKRIDTYYLTYGTDT